VLCMHLCILSWVSLTREVPIASRDLHCICGFLWDSILLHTKSPLFPAIKHLQLDLYQLYH
jgi:hypothetical protein